MGAILKLVSSLLQKVKGAPKDVALEQHLCIQASSAVRVIRRNPASVQPQPSLGHQKNVWSCGAPRESANGGETGNFWSVDEVCRKEGAGEQIYSWRCAFDLSECTATAEPHSPMVYGFEPDARIQKCFRFSSRLVLVLRFNSR